MWPGCGGFEVSSTEWIIWMEDLDGDSVGAGSKMSRLGSLRLMEMVVPDGFAITTAAYEAFLAEHDLATFIDTRLAAVTHENPASLKEAAADVAAAIEQAPMPPDLEMAIVDAYEELAVRTRDPHPAVAVRSSATGEDSSQASFAGQYSTVLGVQGTGRVLEAVRRCWASLFTERAVGYRRSAGIDYRDCPMAVGVLELVPARASGVAFSVHPVSGKADRVVIEGNWGWGEAVVQGLVDPDHVEVGKADLRVLTHSVGDKRVVSALDSAAGCVVELPMPDRLRCAPVFDDEEIRAVASAVIHLEEFHGHPVDVEWVLHRQRRPGDPVPIVQVRPVTGDAADALQAGATGEVEWDTTAAFSRFVLS